MNKIIAFLLVAAIFVTGCQPSAEKIQTAIAETQTAAPSLTATIIPPNTPTLTPTPTSTYTPSPTSTPDLRVIKVDPKELLLNKGDLPPEGRYYLPGSNWTSTYRNSEVIKAWGVEDGTKYINETGRIDGWWVDYKRGASSVVMPEVVFNNIILYQTAEGAKLTVEKYEDRKLQDGYIKVDSDFTIGDATRSYELEQNNRYWYSISFAYKNYVSVVTGYGLKTEVKPAFVEAICIVMLEKLMAAPLSPPY